MEYAQHPYTSPVRNNNNNIIVGCERNTTMIILMYKVSISYVLLYMGPY